MSDAREIVERLREAQSAVDSFRGDLGSAAFEDACRTARHRAFLAAPALLAQLDEQAAEITRLRALSAQPAAVPGWQPIETAPHGVMLLFADMKATEARHWIFCGWRHSGLRGDSVQMPDNTARSATHWMPLPAAPQAPQQDEAGHNVRGEATATARGNR